MRGPLYAPGKPTYYFILFQCKKNPNTCPISMFFQKSFDTPFCLLSKFEDIFFSQTRSSLEYFYCRFKKLSLFFSFQFLRAFLAVRPIIETFVLHQFSLYLYIIPNVKCKYLNFFQTSDLKYLKGLQIFCQKYQIVHTQFLNKSKHCQEFHKYE